MTRKILECDKESCYKIIFKIRNVKFIVKRKKELKKFIDFSECIRILSILFSTFLKILFSKKKKKTKAITLNLFVESPEKCSSVIWNLVTKSYSKLATLSSF